jgi:hypothetical protein
MGERQGLEIVDLDLSMVGRSARNFPCSKIAAPIFMAA